MVIKFSLKEKEFKAYGWLLRFYTKNKGREEQAQKVLLLASRGDIFIF